MKNEIQEKVSIKEKGSLQGKIIDVVYSSNRFDL